MTQNAWMYVQPQTQITTNSYDEHYGSKIDTLEIGAKHVGYTVTLPNANYGATVKLQGLIAEDSEAWVDLKPMDETGSQYASTEIAIAAGGTKHLLIAPDLVDGALACFRLYRVVQKATTNDSHTQVRVRGFAK